MVIWLYKKGKKDGVKKSMSKNRGSPFSKIVQDLVFILLYNL